VSIRLLLWSSTNGCLLYWRVRRSHRLLWITPRTTLTCLKVALSWSISAISMTLSIACYPRTLLLAQRSCSFLCFRWEV
jgi:hypothetical protein